MHSTAAAASVQEVLAASLAMDAPEGLFLHAPADINAFFAFSGPHRSIVKARTLLMLAASYGATQCTAQLLAMGASPNLAAPDDGATALHLACKAQAAPVIDVLLAHGSDRALKDHAGRLPSELLSLDACQASQERPACTNDPDSSQQSDDFRMFSFKIAACPKLGMLHDWNECPYLHPGEKARRRDPRVFPYQAVACPDFRKGICRRGDACPFAHGVFECWLHPGRYRTQLCKEGVACTRAVCFFAHSVEQLREPADVRGGAGTSTVRELAPINTTWGGAAKPCSQPGSPGSTLLLQQSSGTSRCASPGTATAADATNSLRRALSSETSQSTDSSTSSTPPAMCPLSTALALARAQADQHASAATAAATVRALQQQHAAAVNAAAALQRVLTSARAGGTAGSWPQLSAPQRGAAGHLPGADGFLRHAPTMPHLQAHSWGGRLGSAPLDRTLSAPPVGLGPLAAPDALNDSAVQQLLASLEL